MKTLGFKGASKSTVNKCCRIFNDVLVALHIEHKTFLATNIDE